MLSTRELSGSRDRACDYGCPLAETQGRGLAQQSYGHGHSCLQTKQTWLKSLVPFFSYDHHLKAQSNVCLLTMTRSPMVSWSGW